jgi:plastocyanin
LQECGIMKRHTIRCLAGAAAAALAGSCGRDNAGHDAAMHGAGSSGGVEPARVSPSATGEYTVAIDNFAFSPRTIAVPAGATVKWTNHDDSPHTATSSGTPRAFASGTLDTDGSFEFRFDRPGRYAYFCAVHPRMTGEVVVEGKETTP